jgi:hypothetical protein
VRVSHKLLIKDQSGEREVMLVDTIVVGRDPQCDITTADPLLSRRHAEFVVSGQAVIVRDLKSRNGMLVNGRRLSEAVLHPGDVVQLSHLAVTLLSRIEARTMLAPVPAKTNGGAPMTAGAVAGEDKTSLLSIAEIQAVAAASAGNRRGAANGNGADPVAGADPAAGADGAKRSNSWSVALVAEDDRTKLVSPPAVQPQPPGTRAAAPPTSATQTAAAYGATLAQTSPGFAIESLPLNDVPQTSVPEAGAHHAARRGGTTWGIAAATLTLAVFCFAFGVTSTMIWLQPAMTARGLLFEHVPVAVMVAFVVILAAGVLAGLALGRAAGRAKSESQGGDQPPISRPSGSDGL